MNQYAVDIQNQFGRWIQLYHLDRLEEAETLFARDAVLWLPDRDIQAKGIDEIRKILFQMTASRKEKGRRKDIHLPHTPAYKISEDEKEAFGTWDIHSYEYGEEEGKVDYTYERIDGRFIQEDGIWKFLELDWWIVGSFVPFDEDPADSWIPFSDICQVTVPLNCNKKTDIKDFYEIQGLVTRFAHNNRKYALDDFFSNEENISFCAASLGRKRVIGRDNVKKEFDELDLLEEENEGKYVFIPAVSAPVIEVKNHLHIAKGRWMASFYTFEGKAFGKNNGMCRCIRRAGMVICNFVKEGAQWKIKDYDSIVFYQAPVIEFDPFCQLDNTGNGKWYQRIGMKENQWKPAFPKMGGCYPDELPVIETFCARWINAYKRGELLDFIQKNSFNNEQESFFHSRGRGRCSPAVVGTDNMMEFFSLGVFHYHHQQITNHGGVSPDIQISADGRYATVSLFDMNTTAYDPRNANSRTIDIPDDWSADNSGFEHTPCRYQFSIYNFTLAKINGVWKLIHIEWETMASFPDIYTAGKTSRGWAGSVTDFKFPKLFEKYQFSSKRKV